VLHFTRVQQQHEARSSVSLNAALIAAYGRCGDTGGAIAAFVDALGCMRGQPLLPRVLRALLDVLANAGLTGDVQLLARSLCTPFAPPASATVTFRALSSLQEKMRAANVGWPWQPDSAAAAAEILHTLPAQRRVLQAVVDALGAGSDSACAVPLSEVLVTSDARRESGQAGEGASALLVSLRSEQAHNTSKRAKTARE
jgi:hypothetical protein